jgi:hypothetical protein
MYNILLKQPILVGYLVYILLYASKCECAFNLKCVATFRFMGINQNFKIYSCESEYR